MRFLRFASLLVLASSALSAQALVLTNASLDVTVVRPKTGSTLALLTGTLTSSGADDYLRGGSYSAPYNAAGNVLTPGSTTTFATINAALAATGTYTGPFIAFNVSSSTPLGRYDRRLGGGPATLFIFSPSGVHIDETFSITVVDAAPAVPGPAAALAFGLGFLRRRKRA